MSLSNTRKGKEEEPQEQPKDEEEEEEEREDTQAIDYEEEMSTPNTPTRKNNQKENLHVVITGFDEDRDRISSQLEKLGHIVSPVLPRKRQANVVLICGKNPKQSKTEEAKLLGVPVCGASFVDALLVSKQAKVNVKDHLVSDDSAKYRLRPTSSLPELSYHNRRTPKSPRKASTLAVVQRQRTKPLTSSAVGDPNAPKTLEGARIVIALEGEIGVGKSTLSKKIAECFPASTHVFQEPVNEKFLNLFYGDTKRYGFAFQWGMLKSRLFQLQLAKHSAVCSNPSSHLPSTSPPPSASSSSSSSSRRQSQSHSPAHPPADPQRDKMVPTFYFWDRSMIGDYIFALWNHLTGGITAQEFEGPIPRELPAHLLSSAASSSLHNTYPFSFQVYESEFGGGIDRIEQLPFLQDISFFVFLNDEPERCKYRVEYQRGNQSEQGIPLSYYEGLDDIHFDLFLRVLTTDALSVLVMSFGQYDDPMSCRQKFCDVFTGKLKSPRVRWMEAADAPNPEDCKRGNAPVLGAVSLGKVTKFYNSEEDIVRAYREVVVPSYPPHPRELLNKTSSSSTSTSSSLSETIAEAPVTPTKPRQRGTPKKTTSYTSSPALSSTSSTSISTTSSNEVILFSHEAWSSCTLDPQEKGVVVTPSPVDFYRNEFKRLVLWHLSRGHEVVLVRSPPTPPSEESGDITDETDTDI